MAMLGAAAVCAGLSVSAVDRYAGEVEAQVGPLVPVVVAARAMPRNRVLTPAEASTVLVERQVPRRFAPPDALRSRADAVGLETVAALARGDYLGRRQLRPPGRPARGAPRWSANARLVEVAVAGARTMGEVLRPGALVDVLITTERGGAAPRTFLALQRVPVVGFDSGSKESLGGDARSADGRLTLRTTLRQAVLLTAADNFAREVRVVPRASRDTRRLHRVSIAATGLGS
jgi:pilus assembly protein CpaB